MPKSFKAPVVLTIIVFLILLATPAMANTYEVKPGETLWGISQRHNLTVEELMSVNGLTSTTIYAGQSLKVNNSSPSSDSKMASRMETSKYGEYLDWAQARHIYSRGTTATVTDVSSGLQFRVKRLGGSNHADSEPLTSEDTAIMRRIYGGSWSWSTRAIIVSVDGRDIAASMNGMPHSIQTIYNNNFPGHFCIHFKNSRNHNTNRINPSHQASVRRAAGI